MSLLIPGQTSRIVDEPVRAVDLTDTGALSVTALAADGPLDRPVTSTDMRELERNHGPAVPWSGLHAYARAFFDRGGASLTVQRFDGPAAAAATLELANGGSFSALSPGTEGNRLSVAILDASAGAARIVQVLRDTEIVEESLPLASLADIAAHVSRSRYVAWDPEALEDIPDAEEAGALTGGVDDHANAGDTQRTAALAILAAAPGTGQLAAVDGGTAETNAALLAAALTCNRHALLDLPPGANVASAVAAAGALSGVARRYGQLWAQHAIVEQQGVLRQVPYSAIQAAKIAQIDRAAGLGPHVAPAGAQGQVAIDGLSFTVTEAERATLNDAQVNVARDFGGGLFKSYSWWSLADPAADRGWLQSTAHREVMRIRALAAPIQEDYVARGITPAATQSLHGQLDGLLAGEQARGAFDTTSDPAYTLNVVPDTADPGAARWDAYATFVPVRSAVRVEFNITNSLGGQA